MSIKLGTTNIILPYPKAYLCSDLVYQKSSGYVDTEFESCPFPNSWIFDDSTGKAYGTNEYGTWTISVNDAISNYDETISNPFDNDVDTYYESSNFDSGVYEEIIIELPDKLSIKPYEIYLNANFIGNDTYPTKIEGFCNGQWETLVNDISDNSIDQTFSLSYYNLYNKFRICFTPQEESYNFLIINEFQITSGMFRKEN